MSRSSKKGAFVEASLYKKVLDMNAQQKRK